MTDTAADLDPHGPAPSSDADAANRLAAVGKADKDLVNDLTQTIGPGPLRTRLIDRLRMSHDGSHFQLVPQAIVIARDGRDVQGAIAVAARHGVPLTFRSGGTSLSGQAGIDAYCEDYACLAWAALELFQATGAADWLAWALELQGSIFDG